MHAVVLHSFGPAENLKYETVPDPVPGPGEVRIAIKAAGVHFIETVMRRGEVSGMSPPPPELPSIFGGEVAGVVDMLGPEVDTEWLGREVVVARSSPGGYAEFTVAPVANVHRIPAGLGFEAAVAMVITGNTALGLLHIAQPTAADVVLVTSAAGGIGRLVVQYLRDLGAKVTGAAGGPAKVAAVRELGAEAVDYNEPGWNAGVHGVTLVLDGVGGELGKQAYDRIVDGGRFVSIGNAAQQEFAHDNPNVTSINALGVMLQDLGKFDFEAEALAAAGEGKLVPAVQSFPLAEAAAAHAALEARATTGKVVLVP
ncbi:zinc-binding dehydrogenase [Kibdelosporangium phytohabitans]|uniref:NADPH quinone oxidoreductase n=1 Tax=Kibdelosporangium phytohabitans TaxID=860235 RepID=A0A0N9I258_9PSEU|nr:zinc-binding dehydrogenase [Kibdelosporangium phytohabitans]ALG10109.1 NADPH quinone oxidoreductase [Kibdelosporangium phytohabitans]MBE1461093.1 NADPH2:quinone reductase [Kibdelosporangium phytohabitans]